MTTAEPVRTEAPPKLHCMVIAGRKEMDDFMHRLGVFEPSKAIGVPFRVDLSLKSGCSTEKALADLKRIFQQSGYRVSAVFAPGTPVGAWRDPAITQISDGKKWAPAIPLFEAWGFVAA